MLSYVQLFNRQGIWEMNHMLAYLGVIEVSKFFKLLLEREVGGGERKHRFVVPIIYGCIG